MNPASILFFEPQSVHSLYPFSIMHPSWELRSGVFRLFEKVQHQFPHARLLFHATNNRTPQLNSFLARFPQAEQDVRAEDMLILAGNVCPDAALWQALHNITQELAHTTAAGQTVVLTKDSTPFAAFVPCEAFDSKTLPTLAELSTLDSSFYQGCTVVNVEAFIITYLWDALHGNGNAIEDDARFFSFNAASHLVFMTGVFAVQPECIALGKHVRIAPCTVLDASKGSIVIGDNVEIMAQTTIVGPCFIDNNVVVKVGTRLYENTSIGEASKVGGELKNTIFQAFGNKQHDGCLGYSFIGEWVNLGAGTNVSDLKNNYSRIRVRFERDKSREINTGHTSLGLLCGDHTKSGINSMFNTGTVTGVSANVFDGGYPEKYIPSFSWGGRKDSPMFDGEKAIELARTVMSRRKRVLTAEEELILRQEFERCHL